MSRTRLLKSIASPSEIVLRIERSFRPTSNSSYSQSSAFQILICWCFSRGVLSGMFQGLMDRIIVLAHPRGGLWAEEDFIVDTDRTPCRVHFHSIAPNNL